MARQSPPSEPRPGKALEAGQKRWAAILFADVEDFIGLSERGGPEKTYELIAEFARNAREIIEGCRGYTVEYAGDSVLAAFGAPTAVEDASLNSCRAALKLQAFMAASGERFRGEYGFAPRIRIGIAGGVIVVGELEERIAPGPGVLGNAVNLASRIQHIARAGEILCTRSIFDQVEGFAQMTSLGPMAIKGLPQEVEVLRLERLREELTTLQGRLSRSNTAFFGRDGELSRLRDWVLAEPERAGAVDLHGPAGIGKSRLVFEATRRLRGDKQLFVVNCNANLRDRPYAVLVELFRQVAAWSPGDPRARLRHSVCQLLGNDEAGVDQLVSFLGRSEASATGSDYDTAVHIRALFGKLLRRLCTDPDYVVVFEDIHWLDQLSAQTLAHLTRAHSGRLKLLFTRRSEEAVGWGATNGVIHWELGPLATNDMAGMARGLLHVEAVPDELLRLIADISEGNSLFVEETVRHLLHTGQVRVRGSEVVLDLRQGEHAIAGDLQHLILSRYDRLSPDARSHLLVAATKGRQFSEAFLTRCFGDGEAVGKALGEALEAGLIEPGPSPRKADWQFAHALFATAIRHSVPQARLRAVHAVVGRALHSGGEENISEHTEELAHHYDRAGNARMAVLFLWKSAQKAFAIYSLAHADQHLERAFALIAAEPAAAADDEFAEMLVLWGRTLESYSNFRKLEAVMQAHLPRVRAADATGALAMCLTLRAMGRCFACEFAQALEHVHEAEVLAQEVGKPHETALVKVAKLVIHLRTGYWPFERILEFYRELRAEIDRLGDPYLVTLSRYYLAHEYRTRGRLRRAAEIANELVAYGRRESDARARSFGCNALALVRLRQEHLDGLSEAADESIRYAVPDTGAWRVAQHVKLWADLMTGAPSRKPEDFLPHAHRAHEFEDSELEVSCRFQYCRHLMRQGRIDEGWKELSELERLVATCGLPEIRAFHRLFKASLLLAISGLTPDPSFKPRRKPGWRDTLRIAKLRPGAVRRAERLLQEFLELSPVSDGVHVARVYLRLGIIANSRKQTGKAREYFRLAHKIFAAEDMLNRAAQALALASPQETGAQQKL
ncbi:MAG TPA: adenylate/guanylate cyclase domain-containing protein [Gammaproteobacteria bacterium]|nr:adenylate/guanylate cyclase domain-containing protein [Gammaproteobacteria bacterium]